MSFGAGALLGAFGINGGQGGISLPSSATNGPTTTTTSDNDSNVFNFGGGGVSENAVYAVAGAVAIVGILWALKRKG